MYIYMKYSRRRSRRASQRMRRTRTSKRMRRTRTSKKSKRRSSSRKVGGGPPTNTIRKTRSGRNVKPRKTWIGEESTYPSSSSVSKKRKEAREEQAWVDAQVKDLQKAADEEYFDGVLKDREMFD